MQTKNAVSSAVAVLLACLRRDFRIARSYKLAFVLRFSGAFFQVIVFFFISRLMGAGVNPALSVYGGNYFAYVLIGLAFSRLFSLSLTGYAGAISEAQQTGTLEAQAVLPVPLPLLVAGANLWPFLFATGETVLYLLLGMALGASMTAANLLAALLILLLACVAISGLGLMGAALILLYKRGNAVAWAVEAAAALLAGVYFPPDLLPGPLKNLSALLPHTYALAGLRSTLLQPAAPALNPGGIAGFTPLLLPLAGFCLVLIPAGVLALRWAYRQARMRGNLAQY